MTTRRNVLVGLAVGTASLALGARAVTLNRPGTAFGTTVNIRVTAATKAKAERALDMAYAEMRAVHKAASLFDLKSEISRLNAHGRLQDASDVFCEIVAICHELHGKTAGAFDPSVQPLWDLWKQGQPDERALMQAKLRVGLDKLAVSGSDLKLDAGSALTFNGVAQGYAADRVMAAIMRAGVSAATVDTGESGLLNSGGAVSIMHPRTAQAIGSISLHTGFIAVSGDYASTFTSDFQHHHIFDPASGQSPCELASVAVVAPTGAMADGLATAFMVMGHKASLACLRQLPGCSALFILKNGDVHLSEKMVPMFQKT